MKRYVPIFEEFIESESNLVNHAKEELKLAGMISNGTETDDKYNNLVANSVIELMKTFASQGHSGFSAGMVRELFNKLSQFQTLTPITSNPEEWMDTSEYCGEPNTLWQNKRNPATFSKDGGKTWYNLDESVLIKAKTLVLEKLNF